MKSSKIKQTKFWLEDFKVLYKDDQFLKFFPSKNMSTNEQLNALTRFSVYLFFIFILFADDIEWSLIPVLILVIGVFLSRVDKFESFYNIDKKKVNDKNKVCIKPSKNNPFMNVTLSDYLDDPDRPEACDVTRDDIQNEITDNFRNNLYKNTDDIFNNKSSERQFYTMPSTTIPNKQKEFAEWLYGENDNCKTNNNKCLKYSNVKYHRENI
tara:strand:+ start:1291 stop:1923 length:633 start_codon:yes stop_codon:yes gene_type:complete